MRLRVAAVANCGAANRFVGSASPRAAAPGSLADVLCPETLQPPHAPDGGGTATGGRRARPGEGLPPPVPAQTSGGLLAVIECACTYITRRRPPQAYPKYLYSSTRRLQSIPCDQHATHAGAARKRGWWDCETVGRDTCM